MDMTTGPATTAAHRRGSPARSHAPRTPDVPLGIRILALWNIGSLALGLLMAVVALFAGRINGEMVFGVVLSVPLLWLSVHLYRGSLLAAYWVLGLMIASAVVPVILHATGASELYPSDWMSVAMSALLGGYLASRLGTLRQIAAARQARAEHQRQRAASAGS